MNVTTFSSVFVSILATLAFTANAQSQDPNSRLIERGEYLSRVGNCAACHTAPGGAPLSGGLPMVLPMGRIFSTNITPEPATGIGKYAERDFSRALREGVAKDGHNLYPAMPYTSYAKVNDADMHALYVYFMHGVRPVQKENRQADLSRLLGIRWPLKIWNAIFLDSKVYEPVPSHDAQWNRGAYLVQGLGHCGACHTARGVADQELALDGSRAGFLGGALIDNWYASDLSGDSITGLGQWTEADVSEFLKRGSNQHATSFGSMVEVINQSTQGMTDADVAAMAHYLKSLPPAPDSAEEKAAYISQSTVAAPILDGTSVQSGKGLYAIYCLQCHGADGKGMAPLIAPLQRNPNLLEPDASSLINVSLNGTGRVVIQGVPMAYPMPSFGAVMSDRDIAEVLTYIRGSWCNHADAVSERSVTLMRNRTKSPAQ
ncbi:mono/diheme cytochrome c family protein [Caballeronia udeis]|uniref:Mono/diheme cytochrome c family protein n=1 Tax=Caballeronia udeis TaxID=1232866 RepID=A0ABW8MWJ5_9BURK